MKWNNPNPAGTDSDYPFATNIDQKTAYMHGSKGKSLLVVGRLKLSWIL